MDITQLRLNEIKRLLLEKLSVHGCSVQPEDEMALKIDLLEWILELLRSKEKHFENRLNFEKFVQGSISIDANGLKLSLSGDNTNSGQWHPPPLNCKQSFLCFFSYTTGVLIVFLIS